MMKNANKNNNIPSYDAKRGQNVLLEKIYSEIKLLSEGYSGVSVKIESMDGRLIRLEEIAIKQETKTSVLEMYAQSTKSQLATLNIKVDRIEGELDTVKKATLENSREIKEINKRLDTVTYNYERRITTLEAKTQAI